MYLLGSAAGGRRNLMTLSWAMQVAVEPKLLAVSVEARAVTHALIREGGAFAVSVLDRGDRAVVRHFVKPVDDDGDMTRLGGEEVTSATTGSPILARAAAWVDCRLHRQVDCGSHTLFLGEVVDCGLGPSEDVDILRMEDTRMSYGG